MRQQRPNELASTGLQRNECVHMQICHSAALLDVATRRNAIANAQALARAVRGRCIIIASCAQASYQLRGPADIANLASLFGLNAKQAKVCLDHIPGVN